MTVKSDKKEQFGQESWRATYFVRYMWAVAILAAIFAVIDVVTAVTGEGKDIFYALAAQVSLLSIFSIIAALVGRSEKLRAWGILWIVGASLYLLSTPLLATGLLPFVMAGAVMVLVTAAVFFSLQSIKRLAPFMAVLIVAATILEQWTPPWHRVNEMVEAPPIPILLNVVTFVFTAFLINLMGQILLQALESSQNYASLVEQSRGALLERTLELEKTTANLEARGAELEQLNRNWQTTSQQAERRAMQLAASAQVARAIGQVRDLDHLLAQVSQLISAAFGHYHIGIFIIDEIGRFAVLRAANSEGGQRMLERGHKLPLDTTNVIGNVIRTGQSQTVMDIQSEAGRLDNADLPNTRSEAICPLRVGQQVFGALDVHSAQTTAFGEEDMVALSSLADQIALAIENARLFTQTQAALQEAEETQRRYMQEQWETLLPTLRTSGYEYHASGLPAIGDLPTPEVEQALRQGDTAISRQTGAAKALPAMAVPIKLRDEVIGVIDLQDIDIEREWTEDEVAFVSAVADQAGLALENARLFMQTQQRARREQLIAQIAAKMRAAPDTEGVMRTAVQEIRRVLGASHGVIRLGMETQDEH